MQQQQLVSPAEYARLRGLNRSTISRQIRNGTIPTISTAEGDRIDVTVADRARSQNANSRLGHGGRPDRVLRHLSIWRAKSRTGFDPAVAAVLNVARAVWPEIMRRAMIVYGANEVDAARGVLALQEMIESATCVLHQEFNQGGCYDYRELVAPFPVLPWGEEAARWLAERDRRLCDVGETEEEAQLISSMLDAGKAMAP